MNETIIAMISPIISAIISSIVSNQVLKEKIKYIEKKIEKIYDMNERLIKVELELQKIHEDYNAENISK